MLSFSSFGPPLMLSYSSFDPPSELFLVVADTIIRSVFQDDFRNITVLKGWQNHGFVDIGGAGGDKKWLIQG